MDTASEDRASVGTIRSANILLAWRRLEVRQIAVELVRQPVAVGALATLSASVFLVLRWAFEHAPQSRASRFVLEAAGSALAFAILARVTAAVQARGPLQGVFFPLVAGPRRRIGYQLFEASLLWLALLVCAVFALAPIAPGGLVGFLAAAAVGTGLASFLVTLGRDRIDHRSDSAAEAGAKARSLTGPMLVARIQWRRRAGPMPAWAGGAAIGLATMIAATLARQNNVNADISEAVLAGGALASGAVAGRIDPQLVRFIGHEPLTLAWIVAAVALPTPVAIGLGTGLGALAMGLEAMIAFGIGLGAAGLLATYLSLAVLHALAGRSRFASFSAGVDLTICAAFLAIYAPLLWVWAPVRAIALIRQARRRRWTDR